MPKVETGAAAKIALAATVLAGTVATGGVMADVEEGLKLFQALEPPIQAGLAALFHKLHHATPRPPAAPAKASVSSPSTEAAKPEKAAKAESADLSSTSLDPDNPYVQD